jgi:hypothetical protein
MKRCVDGREFVSDMRSGLTETELMEKYRITSRCLQNLYRKLLKANAISRHELRTDVRACLYANTVEVHSLRTLPRESVICPLLTYTTEDTDTIGRVMDISLGGVGTIGLPAEAGDERTLIIAADKFFDVSQITLSVVCRWTKSENGRPPIAGWEILFSSRESEQALIELIRSLSSEGCVIPQA